MLIRHKMVAALSSGALLSVAASAAPKFPIFAGQSTPLRDVLSRIEHSRLVAGYVWTQNDLAVAVQLYPEPMDYRVEDAPPGTVPWRPAAVLGWSVQHKMTTSEQELFRRSRFTLILREQDGATCTVNELTGARIFDQKAEAQDATAREMQCERIWLYVASLRELPPDWQLQIKQRLQTPPRPPTFVRRKINH